MTVAMIFAIVAVSFWSFRQFTISTEREHIRSIAGIVEVGLTELMVHSAIQDRDSFLSRIAKVKGINKVHVECRTVFSMR
jgi:hypothetical protein